MFLRSLYIEDWRAIKSLEVSFEPGLNIVHGPNESGKSSLREALRCAFVYPSRPRGKTDVSSARPWGTKKKPVVEVRFSHNDSEWMIRKVFFTDESELQCDGRVLAQGTSVQNELTKVLATDGLSALWSVQGEPDSPGVPGDLRGRFAAADAITPGSHWLIGQVDSRYEQFWTSKTQKPRQPLLEVRDAAREAERQVEQLEDRLYEVNELSRQTDTQDDELLGLKERQKEANEQFRQEKEKLRETISRLEQSRDRALNWHKKWDACWSRVEEEYQKTQVHAARVAERRELLGEEPTRDELELLGHRETYLQWLAQEKIRSELEELGETDKALKALERIESQTQKVQDLLELLEQASVQDEVDGDEPNLTQREEQLQDLQSKMEKLSQDLQTWAEAERERERIEREISALVTLIEDWTQVCESLNAAWEEQQTHQEKLQALKDKVGPEPERDEIEALQKQQSYLQAAVHRKLRLELDALKAPGRDALAEMAADQQKLQSLKGRLSEAPAAKPPTGKSQLPKIVSLAAGVSVIGFGFAAHHELGASKSFGLAFLLFGVAALFGYFFFGSASTEPDSAEDDLQEQITELEKRIAALFAEHECETLAQARARADRRQALQAQLDSSATGDPDALDDDEEERAAIDALDIEELRARLKLLPDKLAYLENNWKNRQVAHAEARKEYEELLKESPTSRVETLMQQMARLAKHERFAGSEIPKSCDEGWIEQLKTASPIRSVEEEVNRCREALEKIEHPGEGKVEESKARVESLKAEIQTGKSLLDEKKAQAQATHGAEKARLSQIEQLVQKTAYLKDEVVGDLGLSSDTLPDIKQRAVSVRTELEQQAESLFKEAQVETREQLEAKEEQRRSLRPLLSDVDTPENFVSLVSTVDPDGQLHALSRLQVAQRLAGLDKEKESAEAAWKERSQKYSHQRGQFEELLKEDPSGALTSVYQQLRELCEESEAGRAGLPDGFDPKVLEQASTPDMGWRELQSHRAAQAEEFRLLLRSPEEASAEHPLRVAYDALRKADEELELHQGQLHQSVGTMAAHEELYMELCRAQEELRDAQRKQRRVEMEADGLKLLRDALQDIQQELEDKLVAPLRDRIAERIEKLTLGAYQDIRISTDFTPKELVTSEHEGAPVQDLSFGTREQVAFLSRLCLADLLSETERHVVVFDDSLVHTDEQRMRVACELLKEASGSSQVIILTCHPERISSLLGEAHVVDLAGDL